MTRNAGHTRKTDNARKTEDARPISTASGQDGVPTRPAATSLILAAVLIAAISAACYLAFAPALWGDFLNWDDDRNFLTNDAWRGLGPSQRQWAQSTYHLGVWQPLAWLHFGAQYAAGGLSPRVYHAVALGWHVVNAMLLFVLVRRLLNRSGQSQVFAASAAAILFAVHPLRVEPVAWISCQPYLPAATFCLLSVLAYLQTRRRTPCTGKGGAYAFWMAASLAAYAVAVGFKAVAVSLPVVLLILDWWGRVIERRGSGDRGAGRSWPQLMVEKLPFFAVAVPVCVWALEAKDYAESRAPLSDFSPSARLAQSAAGLWLYIARTAWPSGLTPYDRLRHDALLTHPWYAAAAVLTLAAAVVLIVRRKQWPGLCAALAAYVVVLLPNLGIVQISRQLTADRYTYLASMPLAILVGYGVSALHQRVRGPARRERAAAFVALMLILVAALIVASRRQSAYWRASESLWTRVLELDPDCAVAHCNLGEALLRRSDYPAASLHLSRAIDLSPDFSFAYVNFAALLLQAQRYDDALRAAREALDADPPLAGLDLAKAHAVYGEACAHLRRFDEARRHTLTAWELGFAPAEKMLEQLDRISPPSDRNTDEPQ